MAPDSDFHLLNDDTLLHILYITGKKSYATFGSVNKKCNALFNMFDLEKHTFIGYLPVSTIEELYQNHPNICLDRSIACGVVQFNRLNLLEWSIEKRNVHILAAICHAAAGAGRKDILDKVFTTSDESTLSILQRDVCISRSAARNSQFGILEWLHNNGCPWDSEACAEAAYKGDIDMLRWLHTHGCPWDSEACAKAAEAGNMDVLVWLHNHGCPWDELTFHHVASQGNLETIEWLHRSGCPWDETTCSVAAERGFLDVLRWLRAHGCPWDEMVCTYAADAGNLEMLKWLYANDCPWDPNACRYALRLSSVDQRRKAEVLYWIEDICQDGYL